MVIIQFHVMSSTLCIYTLDVLVCTWLQFEDKTFECRCKYKLVRISQVTCRDMPLILPYKNIVPKVSTEDPMKSRGINRLVKMLTLLL